jgi:hypothetical protein
MAEIHVTQLGVSGLFTIAHLKRRRQASAQDNARGEDWLSITHKLNSDHDSQRNTNASTLSHPLVKSTAKAGSNSQ